MSGPGSSARAIAPARPRSSGTHSSSMSTLAATSAVGCVSARPFAGTAARTASSRYGVAREAVDGVGRRRSRAGRPRIALDGGVDVRSRRPSTTRSRPVRSGVVATRRSRARRAAPRSRRLPVAHLEHEPAAGHEHLERCAGDRLGGARCRRARRCGSNSRTSGISVGELVRLDVRRVRDDEVVRAARQARRRSCSSSSIVEPGPRGVLAGQRERIGRDVDRGHARVRDARRRSRVRSRRCPCRRRARAAPRARAEVRARARRRSPSRAAGSAPARSTASVSRRNPHSPRM